MLLHRLSSLSHNPHKVRDLEGNLSDVQSTKQELAQEDVREAKSKVANLNLKVWWAVAVVSLG